MTFMKETYPAEKYEMGFGELWKAMWEDHWDLSKPDKMAECLARHLSNADVKKIMEGANTPEIKKRLNETTQKALETGVDDGAAHDMWKHRGDVYPIVLIVALLSSKQISAMSILAKEQ
ncbi:hypothetical protein FKW77_008027 [Venturia effusa]|uniref:Uncharacterized protein n=1 Tax=Venturia effusa TaxID=50376 RepID=A0A517L9P3_9PEZI|nr:hypothetical protein FKW77_008027 [Venturia effusa]